MTDGARATAAQLLTTAEGLLAGQRSLGHTNPTRAACWIGRRALEFLVEAWLADRQVQTGAAKMAAKLTCLAWGYRDDAGFAVAVQQSWDRLSNGCHQHAYDLAPTHAEASTMIATLRLLSSRAPG